jgi:aminopeptidase C
MEQNLNNIINNKNEKLFQNFTSLFKLLIKPQKINFGADHKEADAKNEPVLDPNEFYSKVLKKYLNSNAINLGYAFEVN